MISNTSFMSRFFSERRYDDRSIGLSILIRRSTPGLTCSVPGMMTL